jgi:hypothetical protein
MIKKINKPKMPKFWTIQSTLRYNNRWYKWFYSLPINEREILLKNGF